MRSHVGWRNLAFKIVQRPGHHSRLCISNFLRSTWTRIYLLQNKVLDRLVIGRQAFLLYVVVWFVFESDFIPIQKIGQWSKTNRGNINMSWQEGGQSLPVFLRSRELYTVDAFVHRLYQSLSGWQPNKAKEPKANYVLHQQDVFFLPRLPWSYLYIKY